jgi:long-chain acyl-CoA synthetase
MELDDFWADKYPANINREVDVNVFATLIDLFKDSCCKYANKPAFSHEGSTLSFAQLDKYSASFAAWIQRHTDLKKGDRVAVQLPNMLQFPIAVFGALRAGLIVVNTSTLYTAAEMEYQFKDSGCKALIALTNKGHLIQQVLPKTGIRYVILGEVGDFFAFPKRLVMSRVDKYIYKKVPAYYLPDAISFLDTIRVNPTKFKEVEVSPDDVAVLQYTGGTTGVSKGAMLTHQNITSNMLQTYTFLATVLQIGRETILCPLPLSHVFAFGVVSVGMMLGAHTVFVSNPRDTNALIDKIESQAITVMMGSNSLFVELINQSALARVDFSKLKLTVAGSMPVQLKVAQAWQQITNSPICEGYGMTESSPVVTMNPPQAIQIGTIGLPIPNTQLRLVDDEGQDVVLGEVGELWIKGPQVMKGYWRDAQATADTISYDGWLKSGDMATVQPDGYIKIVSRKKDMILVSGFNVYPLEIEDVALTHVGILDCAAVGVKDFKAGESVRLFVVKKDPYLTEDEVVEHLKKELAVYKIPRSIVFIDNIPRSKLGKVLRRELRDKDPLS